MCDVFELHSRCVKYDVVVVVDVCAGRQMWADVCHIINYFICDA